MRPISRRGRSWQPTCFASGFQSFVGGGNINVAGGLRSGVLSGDANDACDTDSAIGAGNGNGIGGGLAAFAFIGAGTVNAVISSSGFIGAGDNNTVSGRDGFIGAGGFNSAGVTGNTVSNTNGFIGAGETNTNSGADSAIVGGKSNLVSGPFASIGAGSLNKINLANYAAIGAGQNNLIDSGGLSFGSQMAFIGSGYQNTIKALSGLDGAYGVINGGFQNLLEGEYGAIGGGHANTVTATAATVGGGYGNHATGISATVPGGSGNTAAGVLSFAAGHFSNAAHPGTFVWSDDASGATQLTSSASNQFLARASGGVKFFSNPTLTTGVALAPGSGTWGSVSDRAVKTNVAAIDDAGILNKVAALPISEWSYISEHGVRHVGPMAQDFYAAFGVGADNKHITSIDEDGVALAAIKALHSQVSGLKALLARKAAADGMERQLQEVQLTSEKTRVARLERQLQKLSVAVASMRSR